MGVCYIYGMVALTGLHACGVNRKHPAIQEALRWLKSIQLDDGGWENPAKALKSKRTYRRIEEPLYKRPGL